MPFAIPRRMSRPLLLALWLVTGCIGEIGAVRHRRADAGSIAVDDGGQPSPEPDAMVAPALDAGPIDACAAVTCGANQHCEASSASCACDTGFVDGGGACVAPPLGDPAGRTAEEGCAR